jgi:FAD/FMN-containing dehydrogenase
MLEESAVQQLREVFRGEILLPEDEGYDAARRVWNAMVDKRPELIARCRGVADVKSTVDFARENDLLLAVRGGSHNVAGKAVCDGGVVVDLSAMRGVRVDSAGHTARAQGGALWSDLDRETQVVGLATTGGLVSTTGIGGLTLGGGVGWLARKFGTSSDNLLSADVVTAAGDVLTASVSENGDLFWGLCGGGGNFGVVTSFEYRVHPVGPMVLGGAVFHGGEHATDVVRFFRDYVAEAPDELTVLCAFLTAGPAPFLPEEAHGKLAAALAVCYVGDLDEGERVVAPLRSFGDPIADVIGPMPYTALQTMFDQSYPEGRRNYWKSHFFDELTDEAIDVVVGGARRMAPPFSSFYFEHIGGEIRRIGEDTTAFGHRDANFDFAILAQWTDPAEDDDQIGWARDFWAATQPFSMGTVYVNNLGEEGEERVRAAYKPEKYERLVALKDKYDRENLFRLNQNIRPSAAAGARVS